MADKKDVGTEHIRKVMPVEVSPSPPSTLEGTLNIMQRRRNVLNLTLARLRRFIRKPVVLWFAGIVFVLLVIIMLMVLLLNIDVTGVDDLLADIPLNTTGVRDVSPLDFF